MNRGISRRAGLQALVALPVLAGGSGRAFAAEQEATTQDDAGREARWQELRETIFGKRDVADGSAFIDLHAPAQALDAALVPVQITLSGDQKPKSLYLVIDENPSPLAVHATFGPAADPGVLKVRVRVNQFTFMHAVMEADDGKLYVTKHYVKAAGGCSAPSGFTEAALHEIGHMELHPDDIFSPGKPLQARLMIRHPNFNGMQADNAKARYIQSIDIGYDDVPVLHLDSDISLSADPVISFGFVPKERGHLHVVVRDSLPATFDKSFPIPQFG